MNAVLYWFRNDLRLGDNLALLQACAHAGARYWFLPWPLNQNKLNFDLDTYHILVQDMQKNVIVKLLIRTT